MNGQPGVLTGEAVRERARDRSRRNQRKPERERVLHRRPDASQGTGRAAATMMASGARPGLSRPDRHAQG